MTSLRKASERIGVNFLQHRWLSKREQLVAVLHNVDSCSVFKVITRFVFVIRLSLIFEIRSCPVFRLMLSINIIFSLFKTPKSIDRTNLYVFFLKFRFLFTWSFTVRIINRRFPKFKIFYQSRKLWVGKAVLKKKNLNKHNFASEFHE